MKLKRWHALIVWLIGTLLAITFIGDNVYFGVAIAILSGILFGLLNLYLYQNNKEQPYRPKPKQ